MHHPLLHDVGYHLILAGEARKHKLAAALEILL